MTFPSQSEWHWDNYARYIKCIYGQVGGDLSHTYSTGLVYITPLQVLFEVTVDRIIAIYRDLIAGNVRVGIYRDNGDTPAGGALVVESASVAAGVAWQKNEYVIANTTLVPELYWVGIQFTNNNILHDCEARFTADGTLMTYSYAQVYGAFTDPCPVVAYDADVPQLWLRVASVP